MGDKLVVRKPNGQFTKLNKNQAEATKITTVRPKAKKGQ